jgi:hypothetical protein
VTTTYDDACTWHATQQGLDPIADVLRAAGLPHTIVQTGGFIMCVHVPLVEGGSQWLYLTAGEWVGVDADLVLVGRYWDCGAGCEGFSDTPDSECGMVRLPNVVDHVRREVARTPAPCPSCGPVAS